MAEESKRAARRKKQVSVAARDRLRNRRVARVCIALIALVVAFAAGFAVRSQVSFVASLGFPIGEEAQATQGSASQKTVYDSITARIEEVEDLLAENSFDTYDLQASTDEMIDALLKSTGDPYAAYYDPERYANQIRETTDRSYAGVGVLFSDYNGRAYVTDVFEGSEAEAKNVRPGDYVVSIDGDSSHVWSMTEVVNAIAAKNGESVTITWMHPTNAETADGTEYTTTLVCQRYDEPNVETNLVDGVGYISLQQITQSSSELVQTAVEDLSAQGATSFVLDLRNNPGGYLTQAVDIASLFLQSGVLVQINGVDGVTTRTASGVTLTDAPMVVLVNEQTSAAAEVLAAALQDNQRAEVVGQTTKGKGSVQVTRELSFGGAVRYTAAYYLSPLGHDINGVGIVPDIEIAAKEQSSDVQLLVALDTARSLA